MKRLQTIDERLENYVDKTGDCWIWTKNTYKYGYGRLSIGKSKQIRAHRYMYEKTYGVIPNGMNVLHSCDNPRCIKPEHLFLGTQKDNVTDMMKKRRGGYKSFKGEEHSNSKLKDTDIIKIKEMWSSGLFLQREIAKELGISQQVISKIVNGIAWKHL